MYTFRSWLLGSFAVGLIAGAGLLAVVPTEPTQPSTPARFGSVADPQEMTQPERVAFADCLPNEDWPRDEIPGSALIRVADQSRLTRVSFDEAMAVAGAKKSWFVASCRRAEAP